MSGDAEQDHCEPPEPLPGDPIPDLLSKPDSDELDLPEPDVLPE